MTYQCLEIKRRRKIPLVVTVWENLLHQGETHPVRRRRKAQVLREADGFLAVTETTAQMLLREGVERERISTIPMSVDTARFSPSPRDQAWAAAQGVSAEDFVVLFIGRFVPEKGIEDLLTAAARLPEKAGGRLLRFCFVGAGPMHSELLAAQRRLPKKISVHPFAAYGDVARWHGLADVLVLPSRPAAKWQEQFGYVLVESMSCGKPVISTCTGSIADVVGDAGLLVPPADPDALAAVILRLAESESERRSLGEKARARAQAVFDATVNAQKIEALYKKVRLA